MRKFYLSTHRFFGGITNEDAMVVLGHQQGQHSEYVFTYLDRPIKNAGSKAWRAAVKRAGIEDFHFHDLRHTWATRHIQSGTSLYVLMELAGWAKFDTVRKYAHLSTQHLQTHAESISNKRLAINMLVDK